jgi:hypothetical protein
VYWLTIILVLLLGKVLELLSCRVVHPEKGLLLGVVSVPCHEDITDYFCPFLIPMTQNKDRYKMESCDAFVVVVFS